MTALLLAALLLRAPDAPGAPAAGIHTVRVQILSTMLSEDRIGEWGFAAIVEADGKRFLVDTGIAPGLLAK